MRIASVQQTNYEPAGYAGQLMRDLRCLTCHMINGHGGDMAPDLTWEGTAVQRDWLTQFLKNPETLRPALIRRMPKFNLSDAEINTLTDYMLTVYQTPEFDRDSLADIRVHASRGRAGPATILFEIRLPVVPHCRLCEGQGVHWPGSGRNREALQCRLDLPLAERPSIVAPRNHRTEPAHDR